MTNADSDKPLLLIEDLCKAYPSADGGEDVQVLRNIALKLDAGQSAAIVGPSGCGKTTLLNIIGTLDEPSSGTLMLQGKPSWPASPQQSNRLRASTLGFVFQEHHLLPQCTAIENVLIPTLAKAGKREGAPRRATELLERVGLADRMHHRPDQLSGGQRQRVAIVRALINEPALLLVDEPTGALDERTADEIMDLLVELNQANNTGMLMVTHAPALAARLDRTLTLKDGQITDGA